MKRRSRDVLVIGEEQLLGELDLGVLEKPQPAAEVAPSPRIGPKVPVSRDREPAGIATAEPEAAHHLQPGRAAAGIDGEECERIGASVRGARTRGRSSQARPWGLGSAGSVGIAAVLATVLTIVLETGGSGPSRPDLRTGRQDPEARGPHAGVGRTDQGERRAPAVPEPGGGDGAAQAPGSSAPSASSRTADAATPPLATASRAPAPEPRPVPSSSSTSAPAREASRATVQREFGP
jgi:hypothetical protein